MAPRVHGAMQRRFSNRDQATVTEAMSGAPALSWFTSFPLSGPDGCHFRGKDGVLPARRPSPAAKLFLAALTSRWCPVPHSLQIHSLTRRPSKPFGPTRLLRLQDWVEYASLTSSNYTPARSHLYGSMVRNALQPASKTDLASFGFARAEAFTSPTKMTPYTWTSRVPSF